MKEYLKTYFFDVVFKKGFDCTGKSGRKEFWLFILNLLIFISTIYAILYFSFPNFSPVLFEKVLNIYPSYDTIIFLQIIFALIILFPILFFLPFINLLARRLHDIGLSAKYLFLAILLIRYAWVIPVIIAIIGCIPGKEEGNKYDAQDIKGNVLKKIFVNGTILILILLLLYSLPTALIKGTQRRKAEANLIINKIAQAELNYFSENNVFLSVDKVSIDDNLGINMQDYEFFDAFSCTINQENFDNKNVEIRLWNKIINEQKDREKNTQTLYVCATQYQNGKLSKILLKLDKKTVE